MAKTCLILIYRISVLTIVLAAVIFLSISDIFLHAHGLLTNAASPAKMHGSRKEKHIQHPINLRTDGRPVSTLNWT